MKLCFFFNVLRLKISLVFKKNKFTFIFKGVDVIFSIEIHKEKSEIKKFALDFHSLGVYQATPRIYSTFSVRILDIIKRG